MELDEFILLKHAQMLDFDTFWREQAEKDPTRYPREMSEEDWVHSLTLYENTERSVNLRQERIQQEHHVQESGPSLPSIFESLTDGLTDPAESALTNVDDVVAVEGVEDDGGFGEEKTVDLGPYIPVNPLLGGH